MMVPRTRRSLEEAFQALEDLVVGLYFDVLRVYFTERSCRMPLDQMNPSPVLKNSETLLVSCSKLKWTGKPTGTKFSFLPKSLSSSNPCLMAVMSGYHQCSCNICA